MVRFELFLAGLALAGLGLTATRPAFQELEGCYNSAGVLYLINQPGLPTSCKENHTPVSWNIQGTPGTPGLSGYELVTSTNVGQSAATCPIGKEVLGGGHSPVLVFASKPEIDGFLGANSWRVVAMSATDAVTAYAICATVAP